MSEERKAYRNILKVTSLFGGVQIFNILLSLIRSKAVAVLLGPAGMGVGGLLSSTVQMLGNLSGLGLQISAVRDIAAAHGSGDEERIARVVTVMHRLVWVTGVLGLLICALAAPWLSELAFGNRDYTMGFVILSVTLLMAKLTAGQLVLLQGVRKLKELALANIVGGTLGLAAALPLYWLYGEAGIVPAMVAGAVMSLAVALYYGRRSKVRTVAISVMETLSEGRVMLSMGFVIMLNGLLLSASDYGIRISVSNMGGAAEVGLYSAGFGIMNSYVGMVFNAMLTDYFPRLSGVIHDNEKSAEMVNQQADIALLILAPILLVFIVYVNLAVWILYSSKFLVIEPMMQWAAMGVMLKAASWPIGFIFVPKGDARLFLICEITMNVMHFCLSVAGYYFYGLEGLGLGFLIAYVLYWIQVVTVARWRYGFAYGAPFLKLLALQFSLGLMCLASVRLLDSPWSYVVGTVFIVISTAHSLRELDTRLGLKSVVQRVRERLGKR